VGSSGTNSSICKGVQHGIGPVKFG
jgi:hypothetical protein